MNYRDWRVHFVLIVSHLRLWSEPVPFHRYWVKTHRFPNLLQDHQIWMRLKTKLMPTSELIIILLFLISHINKSNQNTFSAKKKPVVEIQSDLPDRLGAISGSGSTGWSEHQNKVNMRLEQSNSDAERQSTVVYNNSHNTTTTGSTADEGNTARVDSQSQTA